MSIKQTLKRLENSIIKSRGNSIATCIIPYCKDKEKQLAIQDKVILENGFDIASVEIIFVIDFAMAV